MLYRYWPIASGYVPVKLVEVIEVTYAIAHLVADQHLFLRIRGAWNIDLDLAEIVLGGELILQRRSIFIRHLQDLEIQREVAVRWSWILDGNQPEDAVILAHEGAGEMLGHHRRTVFFNQDAVGVIVNAPALGKCRQGSRDQQQ